MPLRRTRARSSGVAEQLAGTITTEVTPAGVTVGVSGGPLRATVSPVGDVTLWGRVRRGDGPTTLSWHVAADDRWHVPASDSTVRQRRIDGCPVVETRLRVPGGDAVERVWAVADRGGLVVVEVENDSPLPFAVAFSGAPVLTQRTPADVTVHGIELPADAIVLPVGHHATVRVALTPEPATGILPPVPDAAAVARGWTTLAGRASRLELPDQVLVEAVTAARCELVLDGPIDPQADPAGFLLDVAELVRLGDDADAWMPQIVGPAETVARLDSPDAGALAAAGRIARAAGDTRAEADIERICAGAGDPGSSGSFADLSRGPSPGRFIRATEGLLATSGALLPAGMPTPWLGHDWAVHGIPTGPGSSVSFALRWHGARPAVLWEQDGQAITLSAPELAPSWASGERTGEALWPAPPDRSRRVTFGV